MNKKIVWDRMDERYYQTGCDHGVLFPMKNGKYAPGEPWNGLTNVTESPGGDEVTKQWADNMIYFNSRSTPEYGGTIECFYTPDAFNACNGVSNVVPGFRVQQQRRANFGFSYRTKKGNATEGLDYGFIIHIVYNASASPSSITHSTVNDSPEAATLSYEFTTVPVDIKGKGPDGKPWKPSAVIEFDSTVLTEEQMQLVEETLYGKDPEKEGDTGKESWLPTPDEWIELFKKLDEGSTTIPPVEDDEE